MRIMHSMRFFAAAILATVMTVMMGPQAKAGEVTQAELVAMLKKQAAEIEALKATVSKLEGKGAAAPAKGELVDMRKADLESMIDQRVNAQVATRSAGSASAALDRISDSLFGLEIHGAITQAYAVSDNNRYMNIDTEDGSFALMDATFNVSKQLTDKLRTGMQFYIRKFGEDQDHAFEIDWANVDYRWRDWMGFRVGRVKTAMGLYTDSQDLDMIHNWAMAPAAVYNPGSRATTISHDGIDVYGNFPLWKAGTLNYTGYVGSTSLPDYDGLLSYAREDGMEIEEAEVPFMIGYDLNFQPEGFFSGLKIGVSQVYFSFDVEVSGVAPYQMMTAVTGSPLAYAEIQGKSSEDNGPGFINFAYAEYQRDRFKIMGEYRRQYISSMVHEDIPAMGIYNIRHSVQDSRGWYIGATYRFTDWFELGAYYAEYIFDNGADHDAADNYQNDFAITARFDINDYWYIKVEDHVMRGYGLSRDYDDYDREEDWNMVVIKTGLSF